MYFYSPRRRNGSSDDVQAGSELLENTGRQAFGEDIRVLGSGRHMKNPDFPKSDAIPDEVQINLDVLRPLMLYGIVGQVHGRDIVAVDDGGARRWAMEFHKQLTEPARVRDAVSDTSILSFSTGARDRLLSLRGP
jgi:hypothetical protein